MNLSALLCGETLEGKDFGLIYLYSFHKTKSSVYNVSYAHQIPVD